MFFLSLEEYYAIIIVMQKNNIVKKFLDIHFDPNLDLRVQVFNLLACAGIATGIITMLSSCIVNAGALSILLSLAATLFAVFLLILAWRKKCYHLCFVLAVVVVFILLFPGMFFTAGGYRSGMPCFFVFAIVFTALMLEGAVRKVFITGEFLIYTSCCLVAYLFPESVSHLRTEFIFMADVLIGFAVSGLILFIVMLLHIRIYDNRQAQLEKLNRLKIEFLGNMSHEMRTPLTGVFGFARHSYNVLTDDQPLGKEDLAELRDNLRLIIVESDRMRRIVEQLLDIAAIEQGKFVLKNEMISIRELIEEIDGIGFQAINTNGNTLEFDISPGLSHVFADRDRLRQILLNLMSNASRHTKGGLITIAARLEHGQAVISVSDNGEGIPEELQGNLFERYLGADIGRAHGTGLGLYICKQIIEAHGGDIRIESRPGEGTAIYFSLPVERTIANG